MSFCIEPGEDAFKAIQLLEDNLYEYNSTKLGKADGNLFSKMVKDENQKIIAGIAGWTWAGVCEITQLWINKKHRKCGIGRSLLETVESEARRNGCSSVMVKSYSFQAPDFYKKYGYNEEKVLTDFPIGYNYHILIKRLDKG